MNVDFTVKIGKKIRTFAQGILCSPSPCCNPWQYQEAFAYPLKKSEVYCTDESGLRSKLGLPSVYFYLAVFDALGDIKSQWTRTKTKIAALLSGNEGFTTEEKHYPLFLLFLDSA